jgi:NO-binding membrane sensor protein with MHYT domain
VTVVDLFSYGWINPVVAFIMSTLGTLLAILLTIKARARAGRGRGRLLVYASVALGAVGVFQAQLLALLGFGLTGAMPRYHSLTLLVSLGGAIVVVGAGVWLVSLGRPGSVRLTSASVVIGAGIAATDYVDIHALRGTGDLYYEPMRLIVSAAIAVLIGCATVWFIVSIRGLRAAMLAAPIIGAAICGMHYMAASAVRVEPGLLRAVDGAQPSSGLLPMLLLGPVILGGVAFTGMLWYFTVGASTVDDLRGVFDDPGHSMEIEPWMIAEVTRRIASGPRRTVALLMSDQGLTTVDPRSRDADPIAVTASVGTAVSARGVTATQPARYPPNYHRVHRALAGHPQP